MGVEEREGSVLATLVRAFAAAAPMFVLLYYSDEEFRAQVDGLVGELRYRVRLAWWRKRVLGRLEGWQQEILEQRGEGR